MAGGRFSVLLKAWLLLPFLVACDGSQRDQKPSGSVWVKVPTYQQGQYQFQNVELKTVRDMSTLRGSLVELLVEGRVSATGVSGLPALVQTVRDSEGVYIATNSDSLQMLTLYAHFERLAEWDTILGSYELLNWPRKVIWNLRAKSDFGLEQNNALYSSDVDAFLFMPYSSSQLPLMANGGVVAHEHFHSIFFQKVLRRLPRLASVHKAANVHGFLGDRKSRRLDSDKQKAEREIYYEVLLRGLNEGLADFWGWNYAGDADFVGASLPFEKTSRSMNVENLSLFTVSEIVARAKAMNEMAHMQLSYQLGTQLSRTLKNWFELAPIKKTDPGALERAKRIYSFLDLINSRFSDLREDELISLSELVTLFAASYGKVDPESCRYLESMISQFERQNLNKICPQPVHANE